MVTISQSTFLNSPAKEVFEKLLNPLEQLKWNTLYLEVHTESRGRIKNGTVMYGKFKGSGKAVVHFENIVTDTEFTHYSKLKMFNLIYLGEFRHNYKVESTALKTKVTQTVFLEPKGLGLLLKTALVKSFKKRMPESFKELKNYIEQIQK